VSHESTERINGVMCAAAHRMQSVTRGCVQGLLTFNDNFFFHFLTDFHVESTSIADLKVCPLILEEIFQYFFGADRCNALRDT
jgi:hypothetical protein